MAKCIVLTRRNNSETPEWQNVWKFNNDEDVKYFEGISVSDIDRADFIVINGTKSGNKRWIKTNVSPRLNRQDLVFLHVADSNSVSRFKEYFGKDCATPFCVLPYTLGDGNSQPNEAGQEVIRMAGILSNGGEITPFEIARRLAGRDTDKNALKKFFSMIAPLCFSEDKEKEIRKTICVACQNMTDREIEQLKLAISEETVLRSNLEGLLTSKDWMGVVTWLDENRHTWVSMAKSLFGGGLEEACHDIGHKDISNFQCLISPYRPHLVTALTEGNTLPCRVNHALNNWTDIKKKLQDLFSMAPGKALSDPRALLAELVLNEINSSGFQEDMRLEIESRANTAIENCNTQYSLEFKRALETPQAAYAKLATQIDSLQKASNSMERYAAEELVCNLLDSANLLRNSLSSLKNSLSDISSKLQSA